MIISKRFRFAPFGLRHELAKRYTPFDWIRSRKVAQLIEPNGADQLITTLLTRGQPALIGRLGGTEARFLGEYVKLRRWKKFGLSLKTASRVSRLWRKRSIEIFTNAGFYWSEWGEVDQFYDEYRTAIGNTDILGAWGVAFTWIETLALKNRNTDFIPVGFTAPWIEPYSLGAKGINRNSAAWSAALEGKKVLVISGFAETILEQHKKKGKFFKNIDYPNFELQAIKAPITSGQRDESGRSWIELLELMKSEMSNKNYDIALIAAGAYSYPLANHAKSMGKIGIHCGGGLQLFFGVMGNRWNKSPEISKYLSEFWVRPSKTERPINAESIENACYW